MKYKHLTIKDYNALKVLQEVNMDIREAGVAVGKSYDTARRVYRSKDWEDYQAGLSKLASRYGKKKTPRVTEEKSSTPVTPSIPLSTDLQESIVELILAVDKLNATIRGAVETKPKLFSFGGIK